jgi:dTDP-4-dehydrorhamnose reductase
LLGYQLRTRAEAIRPISSTEFQAAAVRPKNSLMDNSKLCSALNIVVPDWSYHARRTIREIRGK